MSRINVASCEWVGNLLAGCAVYLGMTRSRRLSLDDIYPLLDLDPLDPVQAADITAVRVLVSKVPAPQTVPPLVHPSGTVAGSGPRLHIVR